MLDISPSKMNIEMYANINKWSLLFGSQSPHTEMWPNFSTALYWFNINILCRIYANI